MPRRDEQVHVITGARPSAAADREFRQRRYLITMGARLVCFVAAIIIQGWIGWLLMAFAIVVPYVAVVLANSATVQPRDQAVSPIVLNDKPELTARTTTRH